MTGERLLLTAIVTLLGGTAGLTGSASAAQVWVVPGQDTARYVAAAGEANSALFSSIDSSTIRVTDAGATVTPGAGCRSIDEHTAECKGIPVPRDPGDFDDDSLPPPPPDDSLRAVNVEAGDMDDAINSQGLSLLAGGGAGDDVIRSAGLVNVLNGGGGRDQLFGAGTLADGDAPEAPDVDILDGAAGGAIVDYSAHPRAVTVDLQAQRSSDGDILRSIEGVVGSSAGDVLRGDGRANDLGGSMGADRLAGGGGGDHLHGGAGDDALSGGAGDDFLQGGRDADRVSGATGNDSLYGGDGDDRVSGGGGRDDLHGGTGTDSYACGAGLDTIHAPRPAELIPRDCERIAFSFGALGIETLIDPHPVRADASGIVFPVGCPQADGSDIESHGTLRVRERESRRLLAQGRISRAAGSACSDTSVRTLSVRAALTPRGRDRLRRRRRVDATVSLRGFHLPTSGWSIRLHRR